jgi:hypothetical protein
MRLIVNKNIANSVVQGLRQKAAFCAVSTRRPGPPLPPFNLTGRLRSLRVLLFRLRFHECSDRGTQV